MRQSKMAAIRPVAGLMEDLLSTQSLANSGVFDHALIEKRPTSFLNGDDRHFFGLWNILMFQAWHREKKIDQDQSDRAGHHRLK